MLIGVDFDNTIADYEDVFHVAALERGLIAPDLPKGKSAVRDFLNSTGRKDEFTALQGYVYGARMDLARPYSGFCDFSAAARAGRHEVFIVSHKTRFPLLGPQYDMHEAARTFLRHHALSGDVSIPDNQIFFEKSEDQKISRAITLGLDVFIDDLPGVLIKLKPKTCRRILFAPDGSNSESDFEICRSWNEITTLLFAARP